MSNAFWGADERPAAKVLRAWVGTRKPRDRLLDAFFASSSAEVEQELSGAVRVLESLEALDARP